MSAGAFRPPIRAWSRRRSRPISRSSTRRSNSLPISYSAELWCEPGRALCAEYASVLVRVEKRRGDELYINDGAYGALFDAAHIGWRYPVRLVREEHSHVRPMQFSFYGPTCDDLDRMAGPFELPGDVGPGDYIEVGMLGAYGCAMRTQFNGFGVVDSVIVDDEPMASLYGRERAGALERREAVSFLPFRRDGRELTALAVFGVRLSPDAKRHALLSAAARLGGDHWSMKWTPRR